MGVTALLPAGASAAPADRPDASPRIAPAAQGAGPEPVVPAAPVGDRVVGRGVRSRTTVLADGSYQLELGQRPMHWADRAQGGELRPYRNGLRPSAVPGFSHQNLEGGNGYRALFETPSDIGRGRPVMQVGMDGKAITMHAVGARPAGATARGPELVYADAWINSDLVYSIDSETVKEEIRIKAAPPNAAAATYAFELQLDGLTAAKRPDGSVLFSDAQGQPAFEMPAPFMLDSSGAPETGYSPDVAVTLTELNPGKLRLEYAASLPYLRDPARAYPVVLDPSVTAITYQPAGAAAQSAPIYEGSPTLNASTNPVLDVGKRLDGLRRDSLLQFPELDTLPRDSTVTTAYLHLHAGSGTNGMPMQVVRNTAAWDDSTVTWATAPAPGTTVYTSRNAAVPGWNQLDLKGLVRQMVRGQVANHGFRVMAPDATAGQNVAFDSAYGSNVPKLVVNYVPATRVGWDEAYGFTDHEYGGGNLGGVNVSTGNHVLEHDGPWTDVKGFTIKLDHLYSSQDPYGQTPHYDEAGAYYGEGWSFSQLVRMYFLADGAVVLRYGDGSDRVFARNVDNATTNTRSYLSPEGFPYSLAKDLSKPVGDPRVYTLTPNFTEGHLLYLDGHGRLTERVNPYGEWLKYTYDASDRLRTIVDMDLRTVVTLEYLGPGNPARLSRITGIGIPETAYGYDGDGDLTTITTSPGTVQSATTTFQYGIAHHLIGVTDTSGRVSTLDYKVESRWDDPAVVDGYRAEGNATAVSQSATRSFRGTGSLQVDLSNVTNSTVSSAARVFSPEVRWNSVQQELLAYVWVPAGSGLQARLALRDVRGNHQYGPWWAATGGTWTQIRLPDAHLDPGYGITKASVQFAAQAGAPTFTGSVWVDHLLVRGVAEDVIAPVLEGTGTITSRFRYDWAAGRTTVTMPGETGAPEDIKYLYDGAGAVIDQDVPSTQGVKFTDAEMDAALAYWTPARMADASPQERPSEVLAETPITGPEPAPEGPTRCYPVEDAGTLLEGDCDRGTIQATEDITTATAPPGPANYFCNDDPDRPGKPFNWYCHMKQMPVDTWGNYPKPYRYVGKLFYHLDRNGDGVLTDSPNPLRDEVRLRCSATVVNTSYTVRRDHITTVHDGNRSTIVTAGHCFHSAKLGTNPGKYAVHVTFVPGWRDNEAPWGVWALRSLWAPEYKRHQEEDPKSDKLRWDWAYGILQKKNTYTVQGRVSGAMGIELPGTVRPGVTVVRAIGYPCCAGTGGNPPFNGMYQWWCSAGVTAHNTMTGTRNTKNGRDPAIIGCEMTGNASGGGWFARWKPSGGKLRSVISTHYGDAGNKVQGPHMGHQAARWFARVRAIPAPPR